ncbi:MAG TPA: nuclear transport factor 2 family protein [Acidimicrobiales bacterium]|nr:nuclear transport factor 2 family protein [Acidimicrobiales bacterium]
MSTTTDLIDGGNAAYRARNLDEFISYFSADAVIRDGDGNALMEGELAIRKFYEPLFRDSPDLRLEIPRRIEFGDYVIDEELVDGCNVAGYPPHLHAVVIYRVKDSKIRDVTFLM